MRTMQSEIIRHGLKKEKQHEYKMAQSRQAKLKFSKREIEDLMGIRRDTFKRVRGSVRRK